MDTNPRTQGRVHPEQRATEFFLGNFERKFAEEKLQWRTKRIGTSAFREDGTPYPSTLRDKYRPVPVFVDRTEKVLHTLELIYGAD